MSTFSELVYRPQKVESLRSKHTKQRTTLKALVTVILLVGIIAVVSISRTFAPNGFTGLFYQEKDLTATTQIAYTRTLDFSSLSRSPFNTAQDPTPEPDPLGPDEDTEAVVVVRCENISKQADQCAFVKAHCVPGGLFNYLKLRYCTFGSLGGGATALAVVIFAFLLIMLLKSLGATADVTFVPSLELVANELKLSPAVAGIVLISLGNSSPDILTSITSVQKGAKENDLGLVLGSISGANMCIGCLILGLAIITAYKIDPSQARIGKGPFMRSLCGLLVCCVPSILLCATGSLRWYDAAILISLYIAFITLNVIYLQRVEARKQKAALEKRKNVYIQSTSSYQVQKTSRSLKENLLEMDDGRFDTADGPVSSTHNSIAMTEITAGYVNQEDELKALDENEPNSTFGDSTPQRGFSLRNLIAQSARNLLADDDEEEEDGDLDDIDDDKKKLQQATIDGQVQYDSEGIPIPQPDNDGEIGVNSSDGIEDGEDEDVAAYMEGFMPDPDWSKPNQTFKDKYIMGTFGKFLWALCWPVSLLRWASVPSCHTRPDYLVGTKKLALHVSFFFLPLIFGIAFVGTNFKKKAMIWIILLAVSVLLAAGLNVFYFYVVDPSVTNYNIRRREVQEMVEQKTNDEVHLDEYQLKKVSELVLEYEIDQTDEMAKPMSMRVFMLTCSALCFIGSIAWLSIIAGELVEILSALGLMFNISPLFLGITLLSCGNSVVDGASNIGLAKKGKMNVAYGSMFSAPPVSSSFGFGLAVLLTTLTSTPVIRYTLSPSILLCWGAVIGSYILYVVLFCFIFKYRPNVITGYVLAAYYACFILAAIVFEVVL